MKLAFLVTLQVVVLFFQPCVGDPSTPTGLQVIAYTDTTITFAWDPVPEHGAVYHVIYYIVVTGVSHVLNHPGTSVTLQGLLPGNFYKMQVAAVVSGDQGVYSSQLIQYTKPAPPENVKLTPPEDPYQLILTWDRPYEVMQKKRSYSILYFTPYGPYNSTFENRVRIDIGPTELGYYMMSGLLSGVYYVLEMVENFQGEVSDPSDYASNATRSLAPINLRVSGSTSTSVTIDWDMPEESETHTIVYIVEYSWSGLTLPETSYTREETFTLLNVKPWRSYKFRVAAQTYSSRLGLFSSYITFYFRDPSTPTGLRVIEYTETTITFAWDPVPEPGAVYNVIYYIVTRGVSQVLHHHGTSVTLQGLLPGNFYKMHVAAVVLGVGGEYSLQLIQYTKPAPPENVKLTPPEDLYQLMLTWDRPYEIMQKKRSYSILYFTPYGPYNRTFYGPLENRVRIDIGPTELGYYMMSGLLSGVYYVLQMVENFQGEVSAPSDYASNATRSLAPINLRVNGSTSTSVTLVWNMPEESGTHNRRYTVEYSWSGLTIPKTFTTDLDEETFTLLKVKPWRGYRFRVAAVTYRIIGLFSSYITYGAPCVTSCAGLRDGDYPSCHGCQYYATCFYSILYDQRPCPASLVWNDYLKQCDWFTTTC